MTKNTENHSGILSIEMFDNLANRSPRFHRISAMLLDHFLMCILIIPIAIVFAVTSEKLGFKLIDGMSFYVWVLIIFVYYNKDFFNAKSPAKRIMGYQVLDRKTEKPATELQCFVRNFTLCVAWPIEVIVGFLNPERRIGDLLANTKVVLSEKEKLKTIWTELKRKKLKMNYIGIIIIGIVYFYGLSYIIP
ncbi:RDD family protein [Algibacter mikhailovii]|uniref:RDD family protein n=1 Tax=Algibacter mikhailovii TaxID=425498 RepID=UPI002494FCFE|nr:RDD family protein [Algibacter mikhailovii]